MDITLDVGELYFGLNAALKLEEDLMSLSNSINSVSVSSELPSAGSFNSMKSVLSSAINDDMEDLIVRLENSKRILKENDEEAAMLFTFFDNGIINGDFEFTDMPLLDQTDYKNIRYSQGTVATSGCGITSVCMVASFLTGELYTPEDLAAMANKNGTSNVERMTWAADYVGLNWYCNENTSTNDLKQMLSEGKIVICLVKNSSHFVVCKGITDDGKILVNDPYGPWAKDEPYSLGDLKMSCGKTWVFDPAQNQHLNGQVDTDVTVESDVVGMLQNENGFTGRESTPGDGGFVDDSSAANPGPTTGGTQPPTVAPTSPSTVAPTTPSTTAPTTPSTTAPTTPSTPAPTTPSTTAPTTPSTTAPTTPSTTAPTSPSTTAPTTPSTTAPTSPSTTAPTMPSTTAPTTPSTTAPSSGTDGSYTPPPSTSTTPVTSAPTVPVTETPTVPLTEAPTLPPADVITNPVVENENVVDGNIMDGSSDMSDGMVGSTIIDNSMNNSNDMNTNIDNNNTDTDISFDTNTSGDSNYNSNINDSYIDNNKESNIITTTTTSKKTDYSKYIVPGVVGTAVVGGAAAAYGIMKNKDDKKEKKKDDENLENNGDMALSDF